MNIFTVLSTRDTKMKNSLCSHGTCNADLRRQVNNYFAIRSAIMAVSTHVVRPGGNRRKVRKSFMEVAFELALTLPHLVEW